VKPCSLPYLTEASCHAFRPWASVVEDTYALPTVSLKIELAYCWKGRYFQSLATFAAESAKILFASWPPK